MRGFQSSSLFLPICVFHRLGGFIVNKCRPVIVKFTSFKTKESVFSSQQKLKSVGLSVSGDFSFATRHARRKLVEFGKSQGSPFKLRYNKLHVGGKCYSYDSSNDTVRECGRSTLVGDSNDAANNVNCSGSASSSSRLSSP